MAGVLPAPLPAHPHLRKEWAAQRRQAEAAVASARLAPRPDYRRPADGYGNAEGALPRVAPAPTLWRRAPPPYTGGSASPPESAAVTRTAARSATAHALPPCMRPSPQVSSAADVPYGYSVSYSQAKAAEAPVWAARRREAAAATSSAHVGAAQRSHTALTTPAAPRVDEVVRQSAKAAAAQHVKQQYDAAFLAKEREQRVLDAITKWMRSQPQREQQLGDAVSRSATQPPVPHEVESETIAPARPDRRGSDRQQQTRFVAPPAPQRRYISPAPPPPPPPPEYRYVSRYGAAGMARSVTPNEALRALDVGRVPTLRSPGGVAGSDCSSASEQPRHREKSKDRRRQPRSPLWTPAPAAAAAACRSVSAVPLSDAAARRFVGRSPRARGRRHSRPELWRRRSLRGPLWVAIPHFEL